MIWLPNNIDLEYSLTRFNRLNSRIIRRRGSDRIRSMVMNKILVDHKIVDGISVNRITGRLDLPGADAMESIAQQRLSAGEQRFVLNLAGVEYISSAGLRFLLVLAKKVQSVHGIVVLCCLTPLASQVINISGFNQLLKVYETEDEAVAAAASSIE